MELKEVNHLLDKFYEGETSFEEESQLYTYFNSQEFSDELIAEKEAFLALYQMDDHVKPSGDFTERIEQSLEKAANKKRSVEFRNKINWISGIAASILVLITFYFMNQPAENWRKDTFSNPQEAYAETQRVLRLISSTMNDNTAALSHVSEFNKSIKGLNDFKNYSKELKHKTTINNE